MAEKFRNKYRIGSRRLKGYDYTLPGSYFITICTRKKIRYFGNLKNGMLNLSATGRIVHDLWMEIPTHFHNIKLDEFVIMPDHIHGIIIIEPKIDCINVVDTPKLGVSTTVTHSMMGNDTPKLDVSTTVTHSMMGNDTPKLDVSTGNPNWKSNSIGSIINQFKRICTIKSRSLGLDLSWQPRYYDHIIRSDNELNRIRIYIRNNPKNWKKA